VIPGHQLEPGTENALKLGWAGLGGMLLSSGRMKTDSAALGTTDSAGKGTDSALAASARRQRRSTRSVVRVWSGSPKFPGGPPTMFIYGDDAPAKQVVTGIKRFSVGETVDAGAMDGAPAPGAMRHDWIA